MKKNKHFGFTLIELLAVIVILAVIAIIVTPMIANTINNVKASAVKASVYSIADSSKQYCVNKQATDGKFQEKSYELNKDNATLIGFTYNSSLTGIISIYSDCSVAVKATDGTYYASKDANSDTIAYGLKPSDFDPTTIMISTAYWGVSTDGVLTLSTKGLTASEKSKDGGTVDLTAQLFTADDYFSTAWGPYRDSITSVNFKDKIVPSDTSFWFVVMENLTSTNNIQNLDTSKDTDMDGMFAWCTSLASLDVSHFNTSNVTNMYQMFWNCSSLTSLDVSSFNTSKVTDMDGMFERCFSLTSLDVSHFNTSKVTEMGFMFDSCASLTSLDVSHFDTSKVTNMCGMFAECAALTSLDVSHFDTSNVTDMSGMFYNCSSLTSLDTSKFVINAGTNTTNMYLNCPAHISE